MHVNPVDFYSILFEELDPTILRRKFLRLLLETQDVQRGSIWVKKGARIKCIEAAGAQSDSVVGMEIDADRPSIVGWVIRNGAMTIAEPAKDPRHFKEVEADFDVKSSLILCFPLVLKSGEIFGALQLIDTSAGGDTLKLDREYLDLMQNLVTIGSVAIGASLDYADQVRENKELKRSLAKVRGGEATLIGQSPAFLNVLKKLDDYARTDFPVLVTGESGTGKELVAREIVRLSPRRDKPFLIQNCSAIPETLLESELFGYKKGAFTGAAQDKIGLFEAAHTGTVFLDEIGDMPLNLQARILRVIQNSEIKPLGGAACKTVDVRIISATNQDMQTAIADNLFREDLFYRLNVLPLRMPSLRERREDIPLLLEYFLARESFRLGFPAKRISHGAIDRLVNYPWRGNIRELENFVKFILTTVPGSTIEERQLPPHFFDPSLQSPAAGQAPTSEAAAGPAMTRDAAEALVFDCAWEELERKYALFLLEANRWNVTKAARRARVNRSTFDSRLRKLGVSKSEG